MSNTNQKPEIISHFTKCSCSGELFEIQYYKDYDDNVEFDLVMWEQGLGKRPLSWKERLRWCWHIFKTGDLWADYMIISPEDAQGIANFITKHNTKNNNANKN